MIPSIEKVGIEDRNSISELDYIFLVNDVSASSKFSLDIKDSDWGQHESILNSLVGTLVKYSSAGAIEPYLSYQFSVSEDRLVWKYDLRDKIFCEDGVAITAETFVEALHRQLRLYSKSTTPIDFENLIGYREFHEEKINQIRGLSFKGNSVIFHFTKPPQNLNEMLRMPYFGFWCPENLKEDRWIMSGKFVSSGPYSLVSSSSANKIVVEKRRDWFSVDEKSPSRINFFHSSLNSFQSLSSLSKPFVVESTLDVNFDETIFRKLTLVHSPPTWLSTLVLSPYASSVFSDINLRKFFLNKLRKNQPGSKFNSIYFYPAAKSEVVESVVEKPYSKNIKLTVGHYGKVKSKHVLQLELFLNSIFNSEGIEFEFIGNASGDQNWIEKMRSNRHFDIRFSSVDAGANVLNFVVKMMFCTKLGVSYPDPSGRICKLVYDYDANPHSIDSKYVKEFNQALYDDASVIPIEHYGTTWILSDKIDPMSFPATVETPLFERIRIK